MSSSALAAPVRTAVLALPSVGAATVFGMWWYAEGGRPGGGLGGASLALALGRLAGLLAGYLLMWQLVLASRPVLLRRRVGLGRLIRWHRANAAVLLTLVVLHVTLLVAATRRLAPVSSLWHAFTWLVSTRPGVLLAVVAGSLFAVLAATSVRPVRRKLGYQAWHTSHLLAYAAVGLAVPHQVQSGTTLAAVPGARVVWILGYVGAGALLLGSRYLRPALSATRSRPARAPVRTRRDALHLLAGAGVGAGLMAIAGRGMSARAIDDPSGAAGPVTPTAGSPSPTPAHPTTDSVSASPRRAVAAVSDVPAHGALDVSGTVGNPAYLVRAGDSVHLLSAVCTHAECVVAWAPEDRQFQCPCHLGAYDQQGRVVSGPPPRPLDELPTVVEDGAVFLEA